MASSLIRTVCCIFVISTIRRGIAESNIDNLHSIETRHNTGCWNVTKTLPYQISLQLAMQDSPNTTVFKHFCGGALIKPDVVVTAAQCVCNEYITYLKNGSMYAVAGIISLTDEPQNIFKSLVIGCYRLKRYYETNSGNIAVLQLKQSAPIEGGNINVIPLRLSHEGPNEVCTTSGWGTPTGYASTQQSNYLQKSLVTMIEHHHCMTKYNEVGVIHIFEDNICAGLEMAGTSPCQADAGGPLVCNGELTGVVSKGFDRSRPTLPGVFNSVHYHYSFIQRAIQIMQYDNLTVEDNMYVSHVRSYSDRITRPTSLLILISTAFTTFLCKF